MYTAVDKRWQALHKNTKINNEFKIKKSSEKNPLSCKFHLQKLTKSDEFLIFVKMWWESISYNRKDLD